MRLTTYFADGPIPAVMTKAGPIDARSALRNLSNAHRELGERPLTVRALLSLGPGPLAELAEAADELAGAGEENALVSRTARLGPPVPDPDKIVCVGANYRDHIAEAGLAQPDSPVLFAKFRNSLVGAHDDVPLSNVSSQVDWEGELAVVIGRRGRQLDPEEALSVVGGYMVFNDLSARDLQLRTSQWLPGKAIDGFGPCGPYLVTPDEVPDPSALRLQTLLNGEVVQDGETRDMLFDVAAVLSFVSSFMTLEPGDIVATGTPAGVGAYRVPQRWLRSGDEVVVRIEGLGETRNMMTDAT